MTGLSLDVLEALLAGDAWDLIEVGRLLIRVRQDSVGPPSDAWYVLVPEVPNHIPVGTTQATITFSIAVTGTGEIGGALTVSAPGLTGFSIMLVVNLTTSGPPSYAFIGLPASTQGLPGSVTLTVTTPVTALPTLDELDLRISTTGAAPALAVGGGVVDGTETQATAKVVVSQLDILAAIASLAGKGLANALSGLTTAPVQVSVPQQDPTPAALLDPQVRGCVGALLTLAPPAPGTLSLPASDPLHITLDLAPTTSSYTWRAHGPLAVVAGLVIKDSVVKDNLTDHGSLLSVRATLPTQVDVVSTASPPIFTYSASAVVNSLDLVVSTRAVIANPALPAPEPIRTTNVHIDALPRGARVTLGDFDPTLSVQAVGGIEFTEQGTPAPVGRVAISSKTDTLGVPVPADLPSQASAVSYTAPPMGPTTLTAQAHDLESAHLKLMVAEPTSGHTVTLGHLDLAYATSHPAVLDLALGTTTVHGTADLLPSTVTLDLDATVDAPQALVPLHIKAAGGYAASLPIPTVTARVTQGQPVDVVYTAVVHDLPTTLKLQLLRDHDVITGDLSMADDVGSVRGTVARTAGQSLLDATASSIPQWLELVLDLRQPDTYGVQYSAVRPIDSISATYTDAALTTVQAPVPGVPAPNHLAVNLLDLPATGADPTDAVQHPLKGHLTLGGSGKVIVEAAVPMPVAPLGVATFELTDQTSSTDPVRGGPIQFSQCVRRIAGSVGDQLAALAAPTGRRTYASAPGLRALEFNTLQGLPQTTFGRLSANPVWLAATFDAPEPVRLDLASDSWPMGDPAISSSWLSATSSPVQQVAFDMSLPPTGTQPGIDDITSMALELVPQSVKVEGVLHTFDGSAQPIADSSGDPDVIAAAHNRRIDLLAILPDRLVVQAGAVEKAPAPVAVTRPPVNQGQWWTGIRFEAAARDLLPTAATPLTTADAWARVAQNHDAEDAAWSAWQQVDEARAHVRMIGTVRVTTAVPPSPDPKHRLGGNPLGAVEHLLATWEAFGHVPTLSAVEISAASFANTGSKPAIFAGLDQGSTSARVVIDDQLDHDAVSENQIVVELEDVPQQLGVTFTPASDFRENNRMASAVALRMSSRDRSLRVHARGGWVYGFPHLVPGPIVAGDGTVRPEGLSKLDLTAALKDLTLDSVQHWSGGPAGEPLHEQATLRTGLLCRGGLAVSGWLVANRPGDAGNSLPGAIPTPAGIHLLQSSVNLPDYADLGSLNNLGLQGATGELYGAAFALSAVRQLALETTSLVDERGDAIPVFLAEDSTTHQRGTEGLRFGLQAKGLPGPLRITSQQAEPYAWPDAPQFGPADRLSLVLATPTPCLSAATGHSVTFDVGNGRPRKRGQLILSSGNTGLDGLGGLQDSTGPALGALTVQTVSLNTDSSRFGPTLTSYSGQLQLPGFIRIDSGTTVDPSRFPVPSHDPTGLDMPSWDQPIDFPSFHPNDHPWVTGLLAVTSSGIARGGITINSSAQPWNSSTVVPSSAPDQIEWGRMQVMDLLLFVPGGAAVDPSGSDPHVAIVQGGSGPPTADDEKKGLGFRVRPDVQLTVAIGTGTAFGQTWDGLSDGSTIHPDTYSTISLVEMSGILSLQAKDISMTAIYVAAAAALAAQTAGSFFGPIGWIVGDVVGTAILIEGVRICLSDNDPCVRDALTHGSWRLFPDPSKIPAPIGMWFEYFGTDGDPGSWHLDAQFWVDLAFVSLAVLPALIAGLEALFAWIAQLVVAPFVVIPML